MPEYELREETPAWLREPPTDRLAPNYHRQWRAYAWRWFAALLLTVSLLPGVAFTLWYCRVVLHQSVIAVVVGSTWLVATLLAIWWQGQFRCPRCRRRYAALGNKRGGFNATFGLFDRVCTNCHLKKFERG